MFRTLALSAFLIVATYASASADVRSVGDVSFDVPSNWTYRAAADGGAMVLKQDSKYWIIAIYAPMPTSGSVDQDLLTAWKKIVLAGPDYHGLPGQPFYSISQTFGYPGDYAGMSSVDGSTSTKLYVLEAGSKFVPVAGISPTDAIFNEQLFTISGVVGSVRLAPRVASKVRHTASVADLIGAWHEGGASSVDVYNSSGDLAGTSTTFHSALYQISGDGSYTYTVAGELNNRYTKDADSGRVLVSGSNLTFKGNRYTHAYHIVNIVKALNGGTVITMLPAASGTGHNYGIETVYLVRKP